MRFRDRTEAGQLLAELLKPYTKQANTLILALPRGGVPVAYEIARQLHLPLDVFLVRKLGLPHQPELAMGAIASGGVQVLNNDIIQSYAISAETLAQVVRRESQELQRRERLYRNEKPPHQLVDKTIILVDDGLATGASMRAAITALRQQNPKQLIVAVPVADQQASDEFRQIADQVVCITTPSPFYGVGMWYDDFSQTTDEEVRQLLGRFS
ncbi:phosphoribosyltransferase [Spirosoma sp. SC4-14]|uniref:phosphoribosyltransferase n=1 Tax=Spirosoma sp. SC4-14 TaxID=3128900 RepID=UPI0030D5F7DA